MKIDFSNLIFLVLIGVVGSAPQNPEINDQFDDLNYTEPTPEVQKQADAPRHSEVENLTEISNIEIDTNTIHETQTIAPDNEVKEIAENSQPSFIARLYKALTDRIVRIMKTPKVSVVITNIGTCIVNGAMEIISFYFPAPLIPLIASAAGLVIPFEPVVMLREKMPVTSYRRAFQTAVKSFLGTFDRYKYEEHDDPYMMERFNRRFMGDSKEKGD